MSDNIVIGKPYSIKKPILPLMRGSSDDASVKLLQAWLVVLGYDIGRDYRNPDSASGAGIDGDFGDKTDAALRNFAEEMGFRYNGTVDDVVYERITMGMTMAFAFKPRTTDFGEAAAQVAHAHLIQRPREARLLRGGTAFGRDNSGPWVEVYNQGVYAAWCNGFTASVYEQAARALGVNPPVSTVIDGNRLWVPNAAQEAKRRGVFLSGLAATPSAIKPGSLFMVRGAPGSVVSHSHIGIVLEAKANGRIVTIEGNTNDGGSAEGIAVYQRERPMVANDYSLVP